MTRPNIVLVMTDQHRADCLSIAGHPELVTTNLDALAHRGARFTSAYTPVASCCPARRSIMTGRYPATEGALDNSPVRITYPESTLPELLRRAGYQTAEIGRGMHQFPHHKRYGFEIRRHGPFDHHDSFAHGQVHFSSNQGLFGAWPHMLNHGMSPDGYGARTWPYDERLHHSTFTANAALDFIEHRDPEDPYFLSVGFLAPHPPLVPLQFYYDRYRRMDLRPPVVGDWAEPPPNDAIGLGPISGYLPHRPDILADTMAGYYAMIHHVDDLLHNLLVRIGLESRPTYVLFCSDHGEMLGDHYLFRKGRPYDASTRIPFLLAGPDIAPHQVIDRPVSLIDVLPTCCDLAGIDTPEHVEGRSLLPLITGSAAGWREYVHAEGPTTRTTAGYHLLTDGREKYVWWSTTGREQFFDLAQDPGECYDLARAASGGDRIKRWRERLVQSLQHRAEGFVRQGELTTTEHRAVLPHAVAV